MTNRLTPVGSVGVPFVGGPPALAGKVRQPILAREVIRFFATAATLSGHRNAGSRCCTERFACGWPLAILSRVSVSQVCGFINNGATVILFNER